jgi:hypothetical protein
VRSRGALQSLVATLSLLVLSAVQAWAQAVPTPSPGSTPGSDGGGSPVAMVLVILAVLVILGAGVKLYDLRRKRESEAVQLQAQISDALLREQLLFGLPIMATARAPLWRRSPATIEVAGRVPTPQARETVLRIVRTEAGRIRSDFQIEDRLAIVPPHAA